ncbi:hypothetical protein Tsubulata_015641 [Turnera subulata]|uniref:Uncharacterized protein n=1 Tax=Turnera subulata TaxID=218843 RepID=A0A9Q0G9B1_9ROSI|nr:hypothetical protein Tsubulata_015641 [Turnera subulata]
MTKDRNGSVAEESNLKNGGPADKYKEEEGDRKFEGRASSHHDSDSESEDGKHKRKHKHKRTRDSSGTDSDSEEDDRGARGGSRRGKRKSGKRRSRSYDSESESGDSYSDSDSEESEYSDSESEGERRRRKRKERRRRREREEEKERKRRKRDKEKKRRREKEKEKKMKKKKKEKQAEKGKTGAVTNSWGKYGIIRETDMWNKRPEFTAWLAEVKQVNLESLPNWEEKQMFKEFMEDHNTATFPSKKYYNLDAYYQRQMEKETKKGVRKVLASERTVFNDEEQRRQELLREREKHKEAQVEALKRSMQEGMAQAMKEQAQLREEMAYQYKLGNFEVEMTNFFCIWMVLISCLADYDTKSPCLQAAAAIQRRLDPDVPL